MDPVTTVLVLMLAIALLALVASKINVPYPTLMVVGGLVICFLPGLNKFQIPPNFIFTLFLPPLLYGGAWQLSWKDFWKERRSIFLLAVGLVLFTTLGIAALCMYFIPGFTWPTAFALGAIISPPDAIAVTVLTKKIPLPRRLVLLLEGESLVNDASALVILKFAILAAFSGQFSIVQASLQFFLISGGGILLGLAIGYMASECHRRLNDPLVETTITFLTPYAAFLIGENLGLSGVLATVAAGLYVSWRAPVIMSAQVRLESYAVWEFVLFMLNGFVFVMFGLGLQPVMAELQKSPDFSTPQLIGYGALLVGAMVFLRFAWILPGAFIPWLVRDRTKSSEQRPNMRHSLLLSWVGMRGVVSLAAALGLPLILKNGSPFPNRGIIIYLTFFAILVTLVLQSLTLPAVIKLLGVQTENNQEAEERSARLFAAREAYKFLKDLTDSTDAFGIHGNELRATYEARIAHLEAGPIPLPLIAVGIETTGMDLHREVLSAERQAIVELRANQRINTEVYQRLMADVDAEELRLSGRV